MSVTIYTSNHCFYCDKAKTLLKQLNADYNEINIQASPEAREQMLSKSDGRRTVPQIFIDDYHVGGCDDLYLLHEKGELTKLLSK